MRIHKISRYIFTVSAIALACASAAACGDSSDDVVAHVQGVGSISKGTLEHWIPIEARLIYAVEPRTPVPEGVVPDPPTYAACIAYLRSRKQKIVETGPKPTTAGLKSRCAQQYRAVRQAALNLLIGTDWTLGRASEAGIKVTDAEVKQRLELTKKTALAMSDAEYAKYLKYTGQTAADMLLRAKVELIQARIQEGMLALAKRLPNGLTSQRKGSALAKLMATDADAKRWVAKTSCRPGYVTSSCSQYRGGESPGAPN